MANQHHHRYLNKCELSKVTKSDEWYRPAELSAPNIKQ